MLLLDLNNKVPNVLLLMLAIITGVILALVAVPVMAYSEASDDITILASLNPDVVDIGQMPVVYGQITDIFGNPISNANVTIRVDTVSDSIATNSYGYFSLDLLGFRGLPGLYDVNLLVNTLDENTAASTLVLDVRGNVQRSDLTLRQIQTDTAQKYLGADEADFANDPIGMHLYRHYQQLYEQYQEEIAIEEELLQHQQSLQNKRDLARQTLQLEIEEERPQAGVYREWQYKQLVRGLDDSIKDMITAQLNYTIDVFYGAHDARRAILDGGGTAKQAQEVYLEKLAVSHKMMNAILSGNYTVFNGTIVYGAEIPEVPEINGTAIPEINGTAVSVAPTGANATAP